MHHRLDGPIHVLHRLLTSIIHICLLFNRQGVHVCSKEDRLALLLLRACAVLENGNESIPADRRSDVKVGRYFLELPYHATSRLALFHRELAMGVELFVECLIWSEIWSVLGNER